MRAAILGAVLAVLVVSAATVFGSSLSSLVSHPALYGWNWNYEINGGDALGDIANNHGQATALLRPRPLRRLLRRRVLHDLVHRRRPDGRHGHDAERHRRTAGAHGPRPAGAPTRWCWAARRWRSCTSAWATRSGSRSASGPTTELRIVGTATLPAIGVGGGDHLEIGSGAILDYALIPPFARNIFNVTPGPNAILVRDRAGANPALARRSLERIGRILGIGFNGGAIDGVERPAEIINYRSLGTTPETPRARSPPGPPWPSGSRCWRRSAGVVATSHC